MVNRIDIILMGATGFTGMHCIPHIHKLTKLNGNNLSWGVAGRSEEKLRQVLENMGTKMGINLSKVPMFIADVEDSQSLFEMAQKTRLIINCVGPYVLYGERVVDACLKASTHHIDVSGEPLYMEKLYLKHEYAKEKGVYIISACGLDSIPCDLGIVNLQQNFKGVLNSVVTYLEIGSTGNYSRPLINYGTWASIVEYISSVDGLNLMKRTLFSNRTVSKSAVKNQICPCRPNIVKGWALPFLGPDHSVVERTQKYFYEVENKNPVQVDTFLIITSIFEVILLSLGAAIVLLFSRFQFGKNLLLNYPDIFTLGLFSKKSQPSDESIEKFWFQITFVGEGWNDNLADKEDINYSPCNKKIVTRVKGPNPGYGSTCICAVAAAITVLSEKDRLAGKGSGGVFTPGAAFAKTSLIDVLNKNGVCFDFFESF